MTLVGLSEGNVAGEAVSRPDSGKACHAQGLVRGPGQVHGSRRMPSRCTRVESPGACGALGLSALWELGVANLMCSFLKKNYKMGSHITEFSSKHMA